LKNEIEPTSTTRGKRLPPDFKQIRRYLSTVHEREALSRFIKAGWTPAELAEYARSRYLTPGRTYPTAPSFQFIMEDGPEYPRATDALAYMRALGYVMPPLDRPLLKHFARDDPDNPNHTPELKAEVDQLAHLFRRRSAHRYGRPLPDPSAPINKASWRRSFRVRNRYRSYEEAVKCEGLRGYTEGRLVPLLLD
jgi:hypothetical protein